MCGVSTLRTLTNLIEGRSQNKTVPSERPLEMSAIGLLVVLLLLLYTKRSRQLKRSLNASTTFFILKMHFSIVAFMLVSLSSVSGNLVYQQFGTSLVSTETTDSIVVSSSVRTQKYVPHLGS